MRRLLIVTVLVAAGCAYRPVLVEPNPITGERGRIRGTQTSGRAPATTPCRETARVKCDIEGCSGPNLDRVTISCQGEPPTTRCVLNAGCTAR